MFYKRSKIKLCKICFLLITLIFFLVSCAADPAPQFGNEPTKNNLHFYKKKFAVAIQHYSSPTDSLKLKALMFILSNMNDQYFLRGRWINEYNQAILKSKNKSVDSLNFKLDSVRNLYPGDPDLVRDETVITDSYLISNIDRAFKSKKYKWAKDVSFSDFCSYVLPYKVGNQEPEPWGLFLKDKQLSSADSLKDFNDVFQVANYVNNHLKWFQTSLNYDYPVDGGYNITKAVTVGTCNSQTRLAAFQLRALGVPTAIDFAPSWGNRNSGHSWNSIIYKNKSLPLNPTGPGVGFYKIEFKGVGRMSFKISKVFRKTFEVQDSSLAVLQNSTDSIPSIFTSKRIKDVTDEYVPVSDVVLNYNHKLDFKFAYLCTFDNVKWIPSFWGQINKKSINFKNMARDILYLPGLYNNQYGITPIGNPFILLSNGQTKSISVNTRVKQRLELTRKYPDDETNKIMKGNEYELFYWDGSWKSLGLQVATSKKLIYQNVPTNALFWLRNLTEGKQERIFTYENNEQIWW